MCTSQNIYRPDVRQNVCTHFRLLQCNRFYRNKVICRRMMFAWLIVLKSFDSTNVTSSNEAKRRVSRSFWLKTKFVLPFTGSRYIFLRCAKKNTRTDETVFVSCKQDVTSSRFLIIEQNLCFGSLVLDTFFCAALRKTLELTKPFSYRVNKTSLRVIFVKKPYREVFDGKTKFVFRFTGSRYIFLRCATKNTRTDGAWLTFNAC